MLKRKHKSQQEKDNPEPGSYDYIKLMRMKNPIEIYRMRLEYLRRKRKERKERQE